MNFIEISISLKYSDILFSKQCYAEQSYISHMQFRYHLYHFVLQVSIYNYLSNIWVKRFEYIEYIKY